MIITFSVENYRSFRDEVTFSMVAYGRDRQHKERLASLKKYGLKILPIASIYGGNASGKSNLIKAISFAQQYIVQSVVKEQLINVVPFKLDKTVSGKPSKFVFRILVNKTIYEYGFEVTQKEVVKEWLSRIADEDEEIFSRTQKKINTNFEAIGMKDNTEAKYFWQFLVEGTLPNKLFLSNIKEKRIDNYKGFIFLQSIYEWFASLIIISPNAQYNYDAEDISNNDMMKFINNALIRLDTGISEFVFKKESITDKEEFEILQKALINDDVKDIKSLKKIMKKSLHKNANNDTIEFNFTDEESDGTQRLIDLLPAFYFLSEKEGSGKVFIIDEFNRSLHTSLTKKLIFIYLADCNEETRKQLIFTTHDVMLLDQDIFRRDEIWFLDRKSDGCSKLSSLSEFNIRKDKRIRDDYLIGRFDGIPKIY